MNSKIVPGTNEGSIEIFVGIKWEVMLVFVTSHSRSTALLTHLIDLYIESDQIFSFSSVIMITTRQYFTPW